jgi:hypothetical protein
MSSFPKALLALGLLSCASLVQAAPITPDGDHFTVTHEPSQAGLYKDGFLAFLTGLGLFGFMARRRDISLVWWRGPPD